MSHPSSTTGVEEIGVGGDDVDVFGGAEGDVVAGAADAVVASDEPIAMVNGLVELLPSPPDAHAPIERVPTNIPEMSRDSRVGALTRFGAATSRPRNPSLAAPPAKDVTSEYCPFWISFARTRRHRSRSRPLDKPLHIAGNLRYFG